MKPNDRKMKEQRPLYIWRIIIAFTIATLIMISVFLFSISFYYSKFNTVYFDQENIRFDILRLQLEKELMQDACTSFDPSAFSIELEQTGFYLSKIEEQFGDSDSRVLDQKKIYSTLEAQHFLLIEDFNENCNKNISTILFFYSNKKEYSNEAERLGHILTFFKMNNREEVMIYSFDFDLEYSLIETLKRKYNVENPNTIIINGVLKEENLEDLKELEELEIESRENTNSNAIMLN
jgi:hypothetical protein